MRRVAMVFVGICLLLIPVIASAGPFESTGKNNWIDPVTTYTNGMPLASSTPLRSHNVYYGCDPDRAGCCGGRYNWPCLNSITNPNTCCTGAKAPSYEGWGTEAAVPAIAGVEAVRVQELGTVPAMAIINGPQPGGQPAGGASSLLQRLAP